MPATVFHILDALADDAEVKETETTREIIPRGGEYSDDDGDMRTKRRRRAGVTTEDERVDPAKLAMNIYLFGAQPDGTPVRAIVEGFRPFFFVRLPDKTRKTRMDFEARLDAVLKAEKRWLLRVVEKSYEDRKLLYGYTGDKLYRFARLTVPSLAAFRALRRIFLDPDTSHPRFELYAGQDALEVCEANLDPMLRFFHLRNIQPCGWVETEEEVDEGQLTVDWEAIGPCATPPLPAAPFLMAAWDIECYSENGEFPLAKKSYDRLAKQLYATAKDGADVARLVAGAVGDPDAPPPGMDGLRHRDGKRLPREDVEGHLLAEKTVKALDAVLLKREGLNVAGKEERTLRLKGILQESLGKFLPLAGDPVIQIGVVLVRSGVPSEEHIFVLGTCDEVAGVNVHSYGTEKEMLLGWAKAMESWNPDVLMGYNVFGFDERYVWDRAEELRLTNTDAFQALTRMGDLDKRLKLEEKFLSSSALGDNTMWIWSAFGRLQVDLFHYVKRSFSLPAYKLDYVCQHFMSGKLSGVDTGGASGQWFLKTKNTADVVIGRYVVLLDETGDTVVEKLRITDVRAKEGLFVEAPTGDDAEDLRVAVADAVKWAIVKDDVSPQDIFRLHRGSAADRATVAAYCVQDCDLTVELYKKLDVFNNAMAMANACSVPVGYIFTRGQGIKIESLIFKECYQRNQCIRVLETQPRRTGPPVPTEEGEMPAEEDSYEGAIVLTPRPGFYFKSPIGVADFASLHPSTIISESISHDTLVWVKEYDMNGTFLGFSYGSEEAEAAAGVGVAWTDIEFDIWGRKEGDLRKGYEKEKKGLRVCRYAQFPGDAKGTLPQIVQGLLAARKAKRKEAEKETDPFKKALLDAEQLAYKLTANSLYGQLGSATFKVRLQHLAASVTAYGRKQIMFAKAAIEKFYGPEARDPRCSAETVYGDTDSLFINFNVMNPETGELLTGREAIVATQELTEEAGKLVTTCLKPPHDFEYDKVFSPFIIFSKKRYVGNKYEESPDDYYQNSMGIATKRRDYAGIVKVIYGGAIRILLTDRDPVAAADFVRQKLMELAEGRASMTQLTMSKSLRSEYKSPTPPAHKVLAERIAARDPGNAPASGDRISFLYVLPAVGQVAAKNQGDRIETPGWIREKGLEVDAKFYMEHQLMNPISQLFALCVEELPGCAAPGGRSWDVATPSDREYAAAEYLFREALNTCDRAAQRRFGAKMFGAAAVAAPAATIGGGGERQAPRPIALPVAAARPKVQATLSSYGVQKMLLKGMEKAKTPSPPPTKTPTPPASEDEAPAKPVRRPKGGKAGKAIAAAAAGKVITI